MTLSLVASRQTHPMSRHSMQSHHRGHWPSPLSRLWHIMACDVLASPLGGHATAM